MSDIVGPVRKPRARHRTRTERDAEGLTIVNAKVRGQRDIDIARELGTSTKTVQRRLDEFVRKHGSATVEAYRQVAEQQLDVLMAAAMVHVAEGDLKGVEAALKVHERRAKLLGLDAPTQVEQKVTVVQSEQEKTLLDLLEQAEQQRERDLAERLASGQQSTEEA
jgi:hypothetical protein